MYVLQPSGRFAGLPTEFFAVSDEAAINYAMSQNCPHGCEVWERERMVARVDNKRDEP